MKRHKMRQLMRDVGRGICAGAFAVGGIVCFEAEVDVLSCPLDLISAQASLPEALFQTAVVAVGMAGCAWSLAYRSVKSLKRASSKTVALFSGAVTLLAFSALPIKSVLNSYLPQERNIIREVNPDPEARRFLRSTSTVQIVKKRNGQLMAVLKIS